MSLCGSRLLGKVDVVPGMFHVATKCWHISGIPLIPIKSYIVLSDESGFRQVEIPLCVKSLCLAWMRCVGWLAGVVGMVMLVLGLSAFRPVGFGGWEQGAVTGGSGILVLALAYKFKPLTHASYCRAAKLGEIANLGEGGMAQLQAIYGVVRTVAVKVSRPRFQPRVSQGF